MVAAVTWLVVHTYNIDANRTKAGLDFSKRYQELFRQRHELNKKHVPPGGQGAAQAFNPDAQNWYREYFDLILNEHRFFRLGLVDEAVFTQWMRWSNHNFKNSSKFLTCGEPYGRGWEWWACDPERKDVQTHEPIIDFLRGIHEATPEPEKIPKLVHDELRAAKRMRRRWIYVRFCEAIGLDPGKLLKYPPNKVGASRS